MTLKPLVMGYGWATYEYRGFNITWISNRHQQIARIYRRGDLCAWTTDLIEAKRWIDDLTMKGA